MLSAAGGWAQETTGTITGLVTDANGGVLPGVSVTVTNTRTGQTLGRVTSAEGLYTAPLLAVGEYEVRFELSGFSPQIVRGVRVSVNDRLTVNSRLEVGGVTDTVEVTANASPVQQTAALQTLIGSRAGPGAAAQQPQLRPARHAHAGRLQRSARRSRHRPHQHDQHLGERRAPQRRQLAGRRCEQRRRRLQHHPALDADARIDRRVQDHHQQLRRRVAAERRRRRQRGHQVGIEPVQRQRLRVLPRRRAQRQLVGCGSRARIRRSRDNPPSLDYNNFGFTFGGPIARDKLFFFYSQEWRRITRAPASRNINVPNPEWLTDPANPNYVAPAQPRRQRGADAERLPRREPAADRAGRRRAVSAGRRPTSTTRGRR